MLIHLENCGKGLRVHTVCLWHGAALGTHQLVTVGAFGRKEGVLWGVFFAICTLCSLFNLKYNSHTEAYEISTMNNYKVSAHVTTS